MRHIRSRAARRQAFFEILERRDLLNGEPFRQAIFEEQWSGHPFIPGNNAVETAFPLGLNWGGPIEYSGPQLSGFDDDYYLFQTLRAPEIGNTPEENDKVTLSVLNGSFPIVVFFSYWDGFGFRDASDRVSVAETVTIALENLPSTTFLLQVSPFGPRESFPGVMEYNITLKVPKILKDEVDESKSNNTFREAADLGTVGGFEFREYTIHDHADKDFFRFDLASTGREEHNFAIELEHFATTDLGLALYSYDTINDQLQTLDIATGPSNRHEVSLANLPPSSTLPPGTSYYLEVFGDGGSTVTNPRYFLTSFAPLATQSDSFEPNDSFGVPYNLSTVQGTLRLGETSIHTANTGRLSIHGVNDLDVFRFATTQPGSSSDFVQIEFDQSQGDLDLLLFSDSGEPFLLNSSVGVTSGELISLDGLPAGTYYAVILGALGASNPSYALTIHAPGAPAVADPFDGGQGNNNRNRATNLGPIHGLRILAAPNELLSIHSSDEDWYVVELTEAARPGHFATLFFDHSLGDLDFELYQSNSTLLAASKGSSDSEFINFAGLLPGFYYLRVFGFGGATNPEYGLIINAPGPDRHDQLNPNRPDQVPNNSRGTATDLRAVGGRFQQFGLSIDPSGDEDWFRFETSAAAAAGNHVRIDFEHVQGDLDLFVYDAAGTELASSQGVSNAEVIDLTNVDLPGGGSGPLAAGTYYVRVVGFDGATNPLYNLSIVAPASGGRDRFDRGGASNNDRAQAVDLGGLADNDDVPGGLITLSDPEDPLSIHPAGDEDWFRIPITGRETASHFASIALDHTQGDLDLELYRNNESQPFRRSEGVANTHVISLADLISSDTHYLRTVGFNAGAGAGTNPAYSLLVNLPEQTSGDWGEGSGGNADNNAQGRATDLGELFRVFQRENLSIHDPADEDWFRFQTAGTGTPGHVATILFNHLAGDLELELYDRNGQLLRQSNSVNDTESVPIDGLPAAEYFLRVIGRDLGDSRASNPQYLLSIDPPSRPEGDYAEANDTRETAFDLREVIGPETFDPLSIHASGNDDWFKFTTTAEAVDGNEAIISFEARLGDLDLLLYDTAGNQLGASQSAQGVERIELDAAKLPNGVDGPLPAGTYLLRVTGHRGATNSRYLLTINGPTDQRLPDPLEENDSFTDAANLQTIEGVRPYGGLSIDKPGDADWFVFQTTAPGVAGHTVEILFNNSEGDLDLTLLGADGVTVRDQSTGTSHREVVSLEGRAAGTYAVRVDGVDGATNSAYQLVITAPSKLEPDFAEGVIDNNDRSRPYNLRTAQGPLSVGGLSIHSASDEDWYKFELPTNATPGEFVRIDFNHTEGNLNLALFSMDQANAIATADSTSDFEQLDLVDANEELLSSGTYLVRVTGTGGAANPSYSLSISTSGDVMPDRYEPNDSLVAAYDLRDVSDLPRARGADTRNFGFNPLEAVHPAFAGGGIDFGFGLNPASAFGGGFGGFGGGFGGFGGGGFGGFGGGFGGFGGFGGGGFGGGGCTDLGYGGAALCPDGSVVGLNPQISAGLAAAGQAGLGPGLGPCCIAMELEYTARETRYNMEQSIILARLTPNHPGALGEIGFGPADHFRRNNNLTQAYYGYNQNSFNNSNIQLNAVSASTLGGISGQGLFQSNYGDLAQFSLGHDGYGCTYLGNCYGGFDQGFPITFAPKPFDQRGDTQSSATVSDLSIQTDDPDYFRFELTQAGLEGQFVGIGFDHDLGDLRLSLLAWSGNEIDAADVLAVSDGQGDSEQVTLAGLPKGVYYLLVEGVTSNTSNPTYNLVVSSSPASESAGDLAEPNNSADVAYDMREVEGLRALTGLSIHESGDEDWFQFQIVTPVSSELNEFVRIDFDQDQGDLDLELYRQGQSTRIAVSAGTENSERIPLVNETGQPLPAGTYLARVVGYSGSINARYNLIVSGPLGEILPDHFEPNNAAERAADLNDLAARDHLTGLTIHDGDEDFFQFTIPAGQTGGQSHAISIEFDEQRGDLNLELLNGSGTTVRSPTTSGGNKIISLDGLAAGQYLVRVKGQDATETGKNRYALHVDAPLNSQQSHDDWTIMVYVTASDLAPFAFEDMNEMEIAAASLPESVNIVVLFDQSELHDRFATGGGSQAAWGGTGRAVIRPDTNPEVIATVFDLSIGEQNTGDPSSLVNFVTWAVNAAPAEHYSLIMWDHGQGVDGFNFDNADGAPADPITAVEMASALQQLQTTLGFRADLLAFDSCNIAMTELADRFGPFTEIIVASQENTPGTGFDYATIWAPLGIRPDLVTVESLASGLVESFENQYRGNALGTDTLSAVRSSAIPELLTALRSFTTATLETGVTTTQFDVLRDARDNATSFLGHSDYRDLGQFMSFMAGAATLPASIRDAAQQVLDSFDELIVAKTSDQRQTSGLSIVLPAHGESASPNYRTQFAPFLAATRWTEFIDRFTTGTTQRPASLDPDFAEANEFAQRAYELHTLVGPGHEVANLSLHRPGDLDWFRFQTAATGTTGDRIELTRDSAVGEWRLSLHNPDGAELDRNTGTGDALTLVLSGRPAGSYLIRVQSVDGTIVPRYALSIDAPEASLTEDWTGQNRSEDKAFDLGIISSTAVMSGLAIVPKEDDWFAFVTPRNVARGTSQGTVRIVSHTDAELTVHLQTEQGASESKTGTGVVELNFDNGTAISYHLSVQSDANTTYSVEFVPAVADTGAVIDLSSGDVQVLAINGDIVVSNAESQLFRAPGNGLNTITFLGTDGDNVVSLANLDSALPSSIPLVYDGGAGTDALKLTGSNQQLDLTNRNLNRLANLELLDIAGNTNSPNEVVLDLASVLATTDADGTLRLRHDADDTVRYQGPWVVQPPTFVDNVFVHALKQGTAEIQVFNTLPWTNPFNRLDSNRDGQVTPNDVLVNFNTLNALGPRQLPTPTSDNLPAFYHDSNGDGFVTPIDPLQRINFLNSLAGEAAEGEPTLAAADPIQGRLQIEVIDRLFAEDAAGLQDIVRDASLHNARLSRRPATSPLHLVQGERRFADAPRIQFIELPDNPTDHNSAWDELLDYLTQSVHDHPA